MTIPTNFFQRPASLDLLMHEVITWAGWASCNRMPPGLGVLTNSHWVIWEDCAHVGGKALYRELMIRSDPHKFNDPDKVCDALAQQRGLVSGDTWLDIPGTWVLLDRSFSHVGTMYSSALPVVEIRGVVLNAFYVAMVMAVTGATHVLGPINGAQPVAFVREWDEEMRVAAMVMPLTYRRRQPPQGAVEVITGRQECDACKGKGYENCTSCGHDERCDACKGKGYVYKAPVHVTTPQEWATAMADLGWSYRQSDWGANRK